MKRFWARSLALLMVFCLSLGALVATAAPARAEGAPTPRVAVDADDLSRLDKINTLYQLVTQLYAGEVNADQLVDDALRGFVAGLNDPYSMYLSKAEMDSLNADMSGTFSGIGVGIEWVNNVPTVSQVYPGTPAAAAGLRLGDQFLSIDGSSTENMTTNDLVTRLRGDTGTKVTIRVQHVDGRIEDYVLVRAPIFINPVSSTVVNGEIGYIRITTFSDGATAQVQQAMADLAKNAAVKGLIIDLRDNGGGLITEAYGIASLLIPHGELVQIVDADGNTQTLTSFMPTPLPWPYVVLVNGNSASASEFVAGAVKDHGLGMLIGQRTFGKGSMQAVLTFPDGDGVRLTTAHFYTPLGHQINGVGIEPDVYVDPIGTFPGGLVSGRLGWRDIFPGAVGIDVLELQQDLTMAGFYSGPLDGTYSEATKQAVTRFRLQHGAIDPSRLSPEAQAFIEDKTLAAARSAPGPEFDAAVQLLHNMIVQKN